MKEKLARGVLWLSGAKVVVNVLGLVSTLVLARLLTPEDFGLVAIAMTLIALLQSVTEMSLSAALIHHQAPTDDHFNSAWTMNALRALLLASVLGIASPFVADFYKDPRLLPVLLLLSGSMALAGLNNPKQVVLTRRLEFWQEFAVLVTQKLAGFLVGVGMALVFHSYWALVAGTLATQIAGLIVSYCVVPFRPRPSLSKVRELWSFSAWVTLSYILNTINWKLDHLLIGTFISPKALGIYTVGDNLAGLPTRETIGPLEQALFPGLRQVTDDPERLRRTYARAQALITMIALPVGFGVGALARPLVELVLGPKWLEAVLIVQVLSCVFAVQTISSAVHPLAMAKGKTRMMFGRDVFGFCLRVPIILVGMWWAGMVGIVFGRMVSGTLGVFINATLVRRLIGLTIRQQLFNSWRSLLSVTVMWSALTATVHHWPVNGGALERAGWLAGLGLAGGATYLALHFALWGLAGKPAGAEQDFIELAGKAAGKLGKLIPIGREAT